MFDLRLATADPELSGASHDDDGGRQYAAGPAGTSVDFAPSRVWSIGEIANQLAYGYWGGTSRAWDFSAGGRSIFVNVSALTATEQATAREALALWSDVTGIRFVESSSATDFAITFSHAEAGAFTSTTTRLGHIVSATVNIATDWSGGASRSFNTYNFQTYVHEIGHALGLGHAGNYNNSATFSTDALYLNDSWATTVMSYFDQNESSYFLQKGFTYNYVLTPQVADVAAMALLYGAPTNLRPFDTVYGFNATAGRAEYDATKYPRGSYTIVDSGGTDTLDYSGFSNNQLIDLRPGFFSNIGANIGNVTIALGTVIENAVGGSGADQIIGNDAANRLSGGAGDDFLDGGIGNDTLLGGLGNDILTGGPGADFLSGGDGRDLFSDLVVNFNGDTIDDFTFQDTLLFSDADPATFTFSLTGNLLSFSGGSLLFASGISGVLSAMAGASGGVKIIQQNTLTSHNDFNGDGFSDVLLQNSSSGAITLWRGSADGSVTAAENLGANALDASWKVAGIGDFNGDGRDDILWRHSSGVIGEWTGQTGVFQNNSGVAANPVDNGWSVVGIADYNGDGRDDILWRHSSGEIGQWLSNPNGSFLNNGGAAANVVDPSWTVMASGDFNGDGKEDILWRHSSGVYAEWQGSATGKLNNIGAVLSGAAGSVVGSGDFNGDGRDDLILRNASSGTISLWLGQGSGQFTNVTPSAQVTDLNWKIVAIGDYNGDGRADLMWKHSSGATSEWFGTASGDFINHGAALTLLAGSNVQSPDVWLV